MKKIAFAIATVAVLTVPAVAQTTTTDTSTSAETRMAPKSGTMMKRATVPANGAGAADDNKQTSTGGQPGGSAERGR